MLLKGLSRGAAGVAVAAPIKTFAIVRPSLTADGRICSISGMQSGAHSQKPDLDPCVGHSPGYWKNHCDWPAPYSSGLSATLAPTAKTLKTQGTKETGKPEDPPGQTGKDCGGLGTKFSDVFGSTIPAATGGPGHISVADTEQTLMWILWNRENTDEFHWVCALLNGAEGTFGGSGVFPYSNDEIVLMYKGLAPYVGLYEQAYNLVVSLEGTV